MPFIDILSLILLGLVALLAVAAAALFAVRLIQAAMALFAKKPAPAEETPAAEEPVKKPSGPPTLVLKKVDDRTAAMVMAIVAEKSGIPANRLHFRSITCIE